MMRGAIIFAFFLIVAVPLYAASFPVLTIPSECMENGEAVCGRLHAGEKRIMEKAGLCIILENMLGDDVFVPMKTAEEIRAFITNAPAEKIRIEACPPLRR